MTTLFTIPPEAATTPQGSFAAHQTFPFRYSWLKKSLDSLNKQANIFDTDDAMVELGVGKNMVRSMRYWCLATRIAEEGDYVPNSRTRTITPSQFGLSLLQDSGWDTYLQDDASLWLIHWQLGTNAVRATTWYWAFNHFKEQEFSVRELGKALERWVEHNNRAVVSESSLTSDISCFLRTYVPTRRGPTSTTEDTLDCPLTTLGLITALPIDQEKERRYRFNNGAKPGLTEAIFLYALLDFWDARYAEQNTLSLRDITHAEGSPGRVFRLDEDSVLRYLDRLSFLTQGRMTFNDDALVRQVMRNGKIYRSEVLDVYYRQ